MDKDLENQLNQPEQEFTLEEILAEFSSAPQGGRSLGLSEEDTLELPRFLNKPRTAASKQPPSGPRRPAPAERPGPAVQPIRSPKQEKGPAKGKGPGGKSEDAPAQERDRREAPHQEQAPGAPAQEKKTTKENVILFPGTVQEEEPESPVARLLKKADDYAEHMFEEEEIDPAATRAERYLPGVDEERPPKTNYRERKPRRVKPAAPDLPAQELASRYGKGLGGLRVRRILVFLLALPLLYLVLAQQFLLPLPGLLLEQEVQIWICAGIQLAAILLSLDLVGQGLTHLGMDTITVLAAFATLADACTMNVLGDREGSLPYSVVSVLALGFGLWGRYLKRQGLRTTCRTAAAARTPYLVTLDENKWNGRPAYTKWSGEPVGFGSQIQGEDGAMAIFRPLAPVLILACLLFSVLATVGKGRPELMVWALSATLCAAASFSGLLAFSIPFHLLSRRLAGQGAALAGVGRTARKAGILLTDTDLFPPGAVVLNGLKTFHNQPLDKVVSVTATLIRDMGSGLERPFHELLRSQGTAYRRAEGLRCYEGGASAVIRGEQVLVGNAAFLHLMDVVLPPGLNVKNAVFCAIEGELAGIFALNYSLHATVRPAISALISNRVGPILATRDFNLIPAMLFQRFKLPVEKMDFPEQERRRALSDPRQAHDSTLVCVLCREGIGPYAEAVVGAKRLGTATRLSAALAAVGSVVGVMIAFYLTSQMAFGSLSVVNLLLFLLLWLVPTLLISGWVGKY